jgi:hypothetical protein
MAGPTLAIREQCPLATPVNDGLMSAQYAADVEALVVGASFLPIYTNLTRPAANAVGAIAGVRAVAIFNSSDNQINVSDGVSWYDAMGIPT